MFRFIVLLLIVCLGCQKRTAIKTQTQINIDSLLDNQIQYLNGRKFDLEKESVINSTKNTSRLKFNDVNWLSELEPFRSISTINKPIYSDRLVISEMPDSKSNLTIKTWVAKELPVKNLKVYYLKSAKQIKKLEVEMEQTNFVFSSQRKLTIDFSAFGPYPVIEQYEITGTQKFFWEAPQQYSLKGTIHLK